jgi:LemA protein
MGKWIGAGLLALLALLGLWTVGQYNGLVGQDQAVQAQWGQVQSAYQRRLDLVPNLVETVKGSAAFEKSTLTEVVEARAKATQVTAQASPEVLRDPAAFAQFQQAQQGLSSALGRLLVSVEAYPQLRSTESFRELQAQLEGTENRITTARNRFIKATQDYNILVRQFPTNLTAMMFGYKAKESFTVENEKTIAEPPKVDFAPKSAVPATPAPAPATTK